MRFTVISSVPYWLASRMLLLVTALPKVSGHASSNQLTNPGFVTLCGCSLIRSFPTCALLICHKGIKSSPPLQTFILFASFSDSSFLKLLSVFSDICQDLKSLQSSRDKPPPNHPTLQASHIRGLFRLTLESFSVDDH